MAHFYRESTTERKIDIFCPPDWPSVSLFNCVEMYTVFHKKRPKTSANVDRFSKNFHHRTQQ